MNHTPTTAARAVRALFTSGRMGKLAVTAADFWQQQRENQNKSPNTWGQWLDSYHAYQLIAEQCNGPASLLHRDKPAQYSREEIRAAMEAELPELFADYWDQLFTKQAA